jgi:cytochrome c-type biogenesis protein CcmH
MALFWIAAAALAGGTVLVVMLFARRAAGGVGGENPTLAVHRRQLSEIDDLADRGLIGAADKAAARAEAGRRLLSTAALGNTPEAAGAPASRVVAAVAAVVAGAVALGLYMLLGAPDLKDQPYKARVAAWRRTDPATLDAPRMAAVLKTIAADRPSDPQVFSFLGKADMAAGDPFAARKAFARAAALAPGSAEYQTELGEALVAGSGDKLSAEDAAAADGAFRHALALDPKTVPARYALGRLQAVSGDRAGGVAIWRGLLADLPATDPRRSVLSAEIDRVAAGGPLEAPTPPEAAQAPGGGAPAFIRAMVAGLAARLAADPNDPAGWARLIRSYGVLHDAPAQADALAKARKLFAGKPDALGPIEAEARDHPAG